MKKHATSEIPREHTGAERKCTYRLFTSLENMYRVFLLSFSRSVTKTFLTTVYQVFLTT